MSRIQLSATIDAAPAVAQTLLEGFKKTLGSVPNLFRLTAYRLEALEGYLGLNAALSKGSLAAQTRERVALAVAQVNGCDYCLPAHSFVAKNLAKLDDAEIAANRAGSSSDPTAAAAVRFAAKIVEARGQVSEADVAAVKMAGYSEAELVEIVAHVALTTLTTHLNEVFETPSDFPVVSAQAACLK